MQTFCCQYILRTPAGTGTTESQRNNDITHPIHLHGNSQPCKQRSHWQLKMAWGIPYNSYQALQAFLLVMYFTFFLATSWLYLQLYSAKSPAFLYSQEFCGFFFASKLYILLLINFEPLGLFWGYNNYFLIMDLSSPIFYAHTEQKKVFKNFACFLSPVISSKLACKTYMPRPEFFTIYYSVIVFVTFKK